MIEGGDNGWEGRPIVSRHSRRKVRLLCLFCSQSAKSIGQYQCHSSASLTASSIAAAYRLTLSISALLISQSNLSAVYPYLLNTYIFVSFFHFCHLRSHSNYFANCLCLICRSLLCSNIILMSLVIIAPPPVVQARRRSATFSAISTWASTVAPGSPVPFTPRTPYAVHSPRLCAPRSPRTPRTPRGRRASNPHRSPTSFLNFLDTPSTATHRETPKDELGKQVENPERDGQVGFDLLAQGYTSVIVQLPNLSPLADKIQKEKLLTSPSGKPLRRLRSLSFKSAKKVAVNMLSTKAQASIPPVPPLPTNPMNVAHIASAKPKVRAHKKTSTPQARYAHLLAPGGGAGALPLAQEVQLAQMLDGGSLDANVRRVTARHARDTASASATATASAYDYARSHRNASRKDRRPIETREAADILPVGGVFRDEKGGMWWDEDERLELVELLPASSPTSPSGVLPASGTAVAPNAKKSFGILPRLRTHQVRQPAPTNANANTIDDAKRDWVDLHSPSSPSRCSPYHTKSSANNATGPGPLRRGSATTTTSASSRDDDDELDPRWAVRPRDSTAGAGGFVSGYSMGVATLAPGGHDDAFGLGVSPLQNTGSAVGGAERRERPRPRRRPAPLTLALETASANVNANSGKQQVRSRTAPATPAGGVPAPHSLPPLPHLPLTPTVRYPLATEGKRDFFAASFEPTVPPPTTSTTPTPTTAGKSSSRFISSIKGEKGKENRTATSPVSRRGSVQIGFGLNFSGFGNNSTSSNSSSKRRASVSVTASPTSGVPPSVSSAGAGHASTAGKSLKHKSSRGKLAGLFKSRA